MQSDGGSDRTAASVADRPGAGRIAPVLDLLTEHLRPRAAADGGASTAAKVLDCGGGSGTFAVPLAVAGADVTVVDISADALATLARRADEARVSTRVQGVQGDVEALPGLVATASFDLVLAHGILGAVDDVAATFAGVVGAVRAGGLLSILVNNPVAGVLARVLAGELDAAAAEFDELDAASRVGPDVAAELCQRAGLELLSRRGVGVFADLVPGKALDTPGARQTLARLDSAAGARAPFADIAGRVHLLAQRPVGPTDGS